MSGLFQAINTSGNSLDVFQQELNTTSQNISNVNTAGYSRQTVTLNALPDTPYYNNGPQFIGDGVSIGSVSRITDMFLQAQANANSSQLGQTSAQLNGSQQVEQALNEPSTTGISSALDAFWSSWSGLASDPSDISSRVAVQQAGINLASKIQGTYQQISAANQQNNQSIQSTISQIQTLANQIANLNVKIATAGGGGGSPNELLDQRDQALSQLSGLVDINTQTASNGAVLVYVNQMQLVNQQTAQTFPTNYDPTKSEVLMPDGTAISIRSGQLQGEMQASQNFTSSMSQLDNLANTLKTQVNALHSTGTTGYTTTGQNFFDASSTGAGNFAVDPALAANPYLVVSGSTSNLGDVNIAQAIEALQNAPQAALGNQSITGFYQGFVTSVGNNTQVLKNQQSTQQAVQTQVAQQISSVSGVNIDEEMTNMLKFQHSYQAAAKMLSTANDAMASLLAMLP